MAGPELGIEVVAPYEIILNGRRYSCTAFLPHFGSRNGLVLMEIGPEGSIDVSFRRAAEEIGVPTSFINPAVYASFDRKRFVEALRDWGFKGPGSIRPSWLGTDLDDVEPRAK